MKALALCLVVAAAVVATVAVMPASSWIFKNQLDLVTSPPPQLEFMQDFDEMFISNRWSDPDTFLGTDPSQQLTHAMLLKEDMRTEALIQYTKDHPGQALGWAALARMSCMAGSYTPSDSKHVDTAHMKEAGRMLAIGHDACIKGEQLEPNNAYFAILHAAIDSDLGRLADVSATLQRAAQDTEYDSHVREQAKAFERAQILSTGYRGEMVRMAMDAQILFPELAHMKGFARYIAEHGTLTDKRNLVQALGLMGRQGETAITMLVGYSALRILLRQDNRDVKLDTDKQNDPEWLRFANKLDAKFRAANLQLPSPDTYETTQTFTRLRDATHNYITKFMTVYSSEGGDFNAKVMAFRVMSAPAILGAFACFAVFAVSAWLFSKFGSDKVRPLIPHLLSVPCWVLSAILTGGLFNPNMIQPGQEVTVLGLIVAAAQVATGFLRLGVQPEARHRFDLISRRRIANVVGFVLAVTAICISDWTAGIGGIAYILAWGVMFRTKADKTPAFTRWASIVVFFMLLLVAGLTLEWRWISDHGPVAGLTSAVLLATIAGSLFTGKEAKDVRVAQCASIILVTVMYVGSVGWVLRGNHESQLAGTYLDHEAPEIRRMAGVH